MNEHVCCVEGCAEAGTHRRDYTIVSEPGEMGVDAWFCCLHLDMLAREDGPPFLDLQVTGSVRS